MKRKGLIVLIVIVAVVLLLFSWFKSTYNNMVLRQETVSAQLGNLQTQYQRRADLIPNLVSTVKGYAAHEQSTLEQVTEARAKATQTTLDIQDATALSRYIEAQGELSSALSRLMAISENYPDLKANQNFLDLQTQLEGTENRISVERRKYNDAARELNVYIKMFPRNLVSGLFGFQESPYFEAQAGAENAPSVQF